MAFDLDHALRYLIAAEGSDLHLKIPSYPLVRLHGSLEPIPGTERLYPEDTQKALEQMLDDPDKLEEFDSENEVDFSYSVEGLGRFRVNAFMQRGSISIVMRAIPVIIKAVEELGLPEVVTKLAEEERGIILLTGTTGSGKSTTLAAMIDHMNSTMSKHIVTIEDPIEFLHRDKQSIINQREVGQDTHSFPPHMHQQVRAMLGGTLKGVISQRLVRSADGGRVATCEIMRMTGCVRDMIMDSSQTGQLPEVIADGVYYG